MSRAYIATLKEVIKMRKYLKNIEDIEALRNTSTKIHVEGAFWYYMFVNGVLCTFSQEGELQCYNVTLATCEDAYIEVEDEPSEDDIGKLGWFWDNDENIKFIDVVTCIDTCGYSSNVYGGWHKHFRLLTPEEVEKCTGYKVVKED